MKNYKSFLLMLTCLVSLSALGQTSKKTLNYQAVILDPKSIDIPGASILGQPLNKGNVCLRFSLLNASGRLDYEETQQVTTDEYGLVNVLIGAGTQAQSRNSTSLYNSFESVVWTSSVKSLQVSVSYDGCNNFSQVSSKALTYTPYALYAEAVDYKNVRDAPTKLSQFSNDAGYLIPKDLDPVKADIKSNTSQIAMANQTITDNKKTSDAAFLIVNQSITNLDTQVAENVSSVSTMNTKLSDQQNQISDNRIQITATNNHLNTQVGVLQGQINATNSSLSNLTGEVEVVSNKSTSTDLGGANPSDQLYPSQKAAKAYVDQVISQISTGGVPDATTLATGKIQLSGDLGGTATSPTVPALANKENSSNKSTSVQTDAASDTKYPSVKAVKTYVDQVTMGTALAADLSNKANIVSPAFTGTPTAPTQTTGDNSTKLATTAFVATAVSAATSGSAGVPYSGATGPVDLGGYELTVSGIVVGIGGGDNTNTSIGNASMRANTGVRNTAFGNAALQANSLGSDNTAVGYFALNKNTATTNPTNIGSHNTAMGSYSLNSNTTGMRNTGVGAYSLQNNTTGYDNSAIGYYSMKTNTTGYRNTANGFYALYSNTTGFQNTANGFFSLQQNLTGSNNTANGSNSLLNNTIGTNNTASGSSSLQQNTTGINNTAMGYNSLKYNSTGSNNTSSGSFSLITNTTGSDNTANGYASLNSNTTGYSNTANGAYALVYNTTGFYNAAHGNNSLLNNTTGNSNTAIGVTAGITNTVGSQNTLIGYAADVSSNNLSNAMAIGYNAKVASNNTIVLGNSSVADIGGYVSWSIKSDRRIKKNIRDTHYGLSTVLQLRPVEYTLISNELKQVGFIAQEVNKLVPEVITGIEGDLEKGEILGITYANLVPVLTKAIQEQQKQIDDLHQKLEAQGKKIDYLITLLDAKK